MIYLLDYKIPKYLLPLRDKLYRQYLEEYGYALNKRLGESALDKIKNCIGCFIYNTAYHVGKGRNIVPITRDETIYSLPLIYNGTKINRKVSYTYSMSVFDWLHYSRRVEMIKGNIELSYNRIVSTQYGCLILQPDFLQEVKSYLPNQTVNLPLSVILVKDKDKNVITKRLQDKQKHLVDMLESFNNKLATSSVRVGDMEYYIRTHKVFNNSSFEQGGRTYMTGVRTMQDHLLGGSKRSGILIDEKPTVELDFKALHPMMIAEMEGITLDPDFDPYGIELEGYDSSCLRKMAKIAMLCILNASSSRSAVSAFIAELRTMRDDDTLVGGEYTYYLPKWKSEGLVPQHIHATKIVELLIKRNGYASGYFFSGCGISLQWKDSEIMDYIIEHFLMEGELILPVHDSIILKDSLKEQGIRVMREAYSFVLGSDNNCRIEVK